MARVVLVTGVSDYLGARVATALQDHPEVARVVGVDSVEPEHPLGRAEFIRAELHDGSLAEAVQDSGADTVLHLRLALAPSHNGREDRTGNGVLGTMQLLAACQRSTTVRRLVVRSTVAVYDCLSEPGQSVPEATKARARKAARARLHEAMEAAKRNATSVAWPAAVPTCRSRCCALPISWARRWTLRSRATWGGAGCRCSPATTPGCSSSTRTTGWK